jgi:hypothetical protein
MEAETKKKFSDLRFFRLNSPGTDRGIIDMTFRQIPKELFEQTKDVEFNVDLLYQAPSKFIGSINTMFYVLIDDKEKIKGVLWGFINLLTEAVDVHLLSIDKEYQFGDALDETLDFIKTWSDDLTIKCITSRPKAYEEKGWKRTKRIVLEINNE